MSTGAERIVLRRRCWRLLAPGFVVMLAGFLSSMFLHPRKRAVR